MRKVLNRWTVNAAALLGLSLASTGIAAAQATAAATRLAEVNAFGGIGITNPDYGQKKSSGYMAGFEYNRITNGMVAPGLQFRFTGTSGNTVALKSYMTGMSFWGAPVHGIHPYMNALVGYGSISYISSLVTRRPETDFVYGLGGGAEIPIRRNLMVRADFLQQTWSYKPHNLTPTALTIGVSYTVLGGRTGVE
jgi:opacity protein-like surface antigen